MLGSSGKGHEYFLRHLLGTTDAGVRAEEAPPELRPAEVVWREPAPEGKLDLLDDDRLPHDLERALLGRRPAGRHLVREARPLLDRPAPVRAHLQRRRSRRRGRRRPTGTRSGCSPRSSRGWPRSTSASAATSSPRRCCTTRPTRSRSRSARCATGSAGECEPVPGKTMPKLIVVERDYAAVAAKHGALGPLLETLGNAVKGVAWKPLEEVELARRSRTASCAAASADGRPSLERVEHACEAILALSATTNGRLAVEGFRSLEAAHRRAARRPRRAARRRPDHLRRRAGRNRAR